MCFALKSPNLKRLVPTLLVVVSALGCGKGRPPNVAIFVLDTARADAFSVHGGPAGSTPVYDRLAEEGVLFTEARSVSAWTVPSHGSLFTGLYPAQHGADHGHTQLAEEHTTLAERLTPSHESAGFSENPHIGRGLGFAQGFDHFEETWRDQKAAADIAPTIRQAQAWLEQRDRSRPFFLFVNLMAPHLPYAPPEAFERQTVPAVLDRETVENFRRFSEWDARGVMAGLFSLEPMELDLLRSLYQAEVSFADARVGEMLASLAAQGELDRTLVMVLADHGENIGHHGLIEHQFALYETLLRIPWVMRLPKTLEGGVKSDAPVQLVDVVPTVLEVVGRPAEEWRELAGVSLLSSPPPRRRPALAQYARPVDQRWRFARIAPQFDFAPFDRRLDAVVIGSWKLIRSRAESGEEAFELFDLAGDPNETRSLAADRPEIVAAMRSWLEQHWPGAQGKPTSANNGSGATELDAETLGALRALGYLD